MRRFVASQRLTKTLLSISRRRLWNTFFLSLKTFVIGISTCNFWKNSTFKKKNEIRPRQISACRRTAPRSFTRPLSDRRPRGHSQSIQPRTHVTVRHGFRPLTGPRWPISRRNTPADPNPPGAVTRVPDRGRPAVQGGRPTERARTRHRRRPVPGATHRSVSSPPILSRYPVFEISSPASPVPTWGLHVHANENFFCTHAPPPT